MSARPQRRTLGRTLIIANPAAQSGAGAAIAGRLQRFLRMYLHDTGTFDLVRTERPGHGAKLAAEAGGYDTVLALGGDGVIHEVANGLMRLTAGRRPALGLVPVGSGNDFARTLGIDDWRGEHFDRLLRCEGAKVDVGRLAGTRADGSNFTEFFVQTCSFGLDAAIALGTVPLRARTGLTGTPLYGLSGLEQFGIRFRNFPARVTVDGRDLGRLRPLLFAIQNGPTYGSGFRVCPDADPADGLLDICYACAPVPRAVALPLFLRAKNGGHVGSRFIHFERARHVGLAFEHAGYPIQADGERVEAVRLAVECLPHELTVLRPLRT